MKKTRITKKEDNYSQWYLDVAQRGGLFEYSPTPGCITFLPKAVAIWEKITSNLDKKIKKKGVRNILLPSMMPMEYISREHNFVTGFSPELAVITFAGGAELESPLVVRPTSEMLFCEHFARNLRSYRDLPIKLNQWVHVVRCEKRTRPFLRTTEFHWQEGHTIHETHEDASRFSESIMMDVYIPVVNDLMGIAGIVGYKPESEKFAGAERTLTYEPMMSNGWALQICTSHVLGKGFLDSFKVRFTARDGSDAIPSYTSWGMSTRTIGGVISCHSDNKGLIIPPMLSEFDVVLLPIYGSDSERVNSYADSVLSSLGLSSDQTVDVGHDFSVAHGDEACSVSVSIDKRNVRLGEKLTDFEISGYPFAIVFGANEIGEGTVSLVSRVSGDKYVVFLTDLRAKLTELAGADQQRLYEKSYNRLVNHTVPCKDFAAIEQAVQSGAFALYHRPVADDKLEPMLKEKLSATIRCIPIEGTWPHDLYPAPEGCELVVIARNF